jgi:hypothetical protein
MCILGFRLNNQPPIKTMTREEIIKTNATPALRSELDYWVETSVVEDWDTHYTYEDALEEISTNDMGDEPKIKRAILRVQVALGDYAPISEEDYQSIQSTGNKRSSYPKIKGQRYEFVGACRTMGICSFSMGKNSQINY